MAPKFGTSGLRGLVVDLTPDLVGGYVDAFLAHVQSCADDDVKALHLGRDLRDSSVELAQVVRDTALAAGVDVVDCGVLPTPALALASIAAGTCAIMVTGSHIPADRNGLKFFLASGEISKADEQAIQTGFETGATPRPVANPGQSLKDSQAIHRFSERCRTAFGAEALAGLRIGVYQHSSAARDMIGPALEALGATTVPLARSDIFIPVDTEAVDPGTREMLVGWCRDQRLDAVVSTDGDADRPMLTDAAGQLVPGDVLGVITARLLGARVIVTPISSCSMVGEMPCFETVQLTRIGSPFVIARMEEQMAAASADTVVVGFEANGGFLLGNTARGPGGALGPLMTRDFLLPIVATLTEARRAGGVRALADELPARFTAADRLQEVPRPAMEAALALLEEPHALGSFLTPRQVATINRMDGLRITLDDGDVVHLRPSGNAPEMRIYADAGSAECAQELVREYKARLNRLISKFPA
ncbi:phosphomannomutase [Aliiroseovarius sp.]|uniref:phosphomannomutase n=1 Tax=Aliiroseovarius sp. TaxID=1872442 RepID=UPI002603BE2F|nr:phosphomannomutase [Aliiroseovarius sp.]